MRKKWLVVGIILFISLNTCLILFDNDDHIDRLVFVDKWDKVFEEDLYEYLEKDSVFDYIHEHNVYFDELSGDFEQFLVEEGSKVSVGDALYTYDVRDIAEAKASLEEKAQQLKDDIVTVEAALTKINMTTVENDTISVLLPDEEQTVEIPQDTSEANMLKTQFIIEQEKELERLQARLAAVKADTASLDREEETITVTSPYDGTVIKISESLEPPLMTIAEPQLQARGILTEQDRMIVNLDMPVQLRLTAQNVTLDGTISAMNDQPEQVELEDSNHYSFFVETEALEQLDVPILPGYHADATITLKESLSASTIEASWLFDQSIWKMTSAGTVESQKVERGIQMGSSVEIIDEVEPGTWVAIDVSDQFQEGAQFITPLKLGKIKWHDIGQTGNWKRHVVAGLLAR
ncbi:efflux RND transporter periplasmic adaptor subunit [Lentibacillus saliphilus]|uniref:efflux RND transporter periplasmic adaptor subunit n=1 Tax=Lentibacillus saliphilus TaxID=2737028 RepID=UPI001C2FB7FD|nr:efflux RND transporter periplasmic adaptor subunit [Lentibacillus saliphilus]